MRHRVSISARTGRGRQANRPKVAAEGCSTRTTLGEQYGSSTESKMARDVPEIVSWIMENGPKPRSVEEAIFQQDRLKSLRSRLSAAYKALHALVMRHGCRDFISGKGFELMTFYND